MIFSILLIFLIAASAQGQFSQFASTADGSALYFSTRYAQKNTSQSTAEKIFIIDDKGLRPYVDPVIGQFSAFDMPSVSLDGKVLAQVTHSICPLRPNQCVDFPFLLTFITGLPGGLVRSLSGAAYVNRNGRFAHVSQRGFFGDPSPGLWDLQTGTQLLRGTYPANPQSMADDGAFAVSDFSAISIFRNGQREDILLGEYCESVVIDRADSFVVFTSRWPDPNGTFSRLRIFDLASRTVRTLAEGAGDVSEPSISDDGKKVLFLSTARFSGSDTFGPVQAFVVNLDGTAPRQLTNDPAGIQSAVLSGNGRVVFALTSSGSLVRLSLDTPNEITELIARTPVCCRAESTVAGSLATVNGIGLYDSAGHPPAPTINGQPLPLVSSSPTQFTFQVPWELVDQKAAISLNLSSDSTFELPVDTGLATLYPVSRNPKCFSIPPEYGTHTGYGKAAHQNFEGLITQDSPAVRGETVHLYATGLGPVDASGRVTQPFTCSVVIPYQRLEAPILFTGLAPGFPGVYQVDLRIPPDLPIYPGFTAGSITITCGVYELGGVSPAVITIPLKSD